MKKIGFFSISVAIVIGTLSFAWAADRPRPFDLDVGHTNYEQAIEIIKSLDWTYEEYTKKNFNRLDSKSPDRGKNTFFMVKVKDLKGIRGIRLFFSGSAMLDAVVLNLDPALFEITMDALDQKYKLVDKRLSGENFTENYTRVLWQSGNLYVELQKLGPHDVRVIYVEQVLYENYQFFLFKPFESFRKKQAQPDWMKNL